VSPDSTAVARGSAVGTAVDDGSAELARESSSELQAVSYVRGALDTREPPFEHNAIQFSIKSLLERAVAPGATN
jgi:hypothetical protein